MDGVYGIGENNAILFYRRTGGGTGGECYTLLRTIHRSSSYMVQEGVLTLINEADSTSFEFTLPE